MLPFSDVLTSLRREGDGFSATIPEGWGQGRATFGGVISGFGLDAMAAVVGEGRPLRSVMVQFVGPATPGAVAIDAHVVRAGRAMTQAAATLSQDGTVRATFAASYGAARPTKLPWPAPPCPDRPTMEGGLEMPYIPGVVPDFTRGFQYRWPADGLPFTGGKAPVIDGAVRLRDTAPVRAAGVLALLDAWPAPLLVVSQGVAPASTVTWMVNFVAPPPAGGWDPAGWWRFASHTAASAEGYATVTGHIWAPDGALVAASHQLVAEFSGRG